MPRAVDHEERKEEIADGLVRLAGREGLHAVTMRSVATEVGISLRLVQYYFGSKARMMHFALLYLERKSNERWVLRGKDLSRAGSARVLVKSFLSEALPDDEESRVFHTVFTAYSSLAMTDTELSSQPFIEGPRRLERRLADILEEAQAGGEMEATLDASAEAAILLAFNHGLGTGVLLGQRTPEEAEEIIEYYLDRLFASAGPDAR